MRSLLPQLPKDFCVIFSSSLKRTLASAKIIAAYSRREIIVTEKLTERDFGTLAGRTWDDIPNGRSLQNMDRKQQYDYSPYGGESVRDVEERLMSFFDEAEGLGYSSAVVVSSIGVIRLAYKLLLNKTIIDIDNASIHQFDLGFTARLAA